MLSRGQITMTLTFGGCKSQGHCDLKILRLNLVSTVWFQDFRAKFSKNLHLDLFRGQRSLIPFIFWGCSIMGFKQAWKVNQKKLPSLYFLKQALFLHFMLMHPCNYITTRWELSLLQFLYSSPNWFGMQRKFEKHLIQKDAMRYAKESKVREDFKMNILMLASCWQRNNMVRQFSLRLNWK